MGLYIMHMHTVVQQVMQQAGDAGARARAARSALSNCGTPKTMGRMRQAMAATLGRHRRGADEEGRPPFKFKKFVCLFVCLFV